MTNINDLVNILESIEKNNVQSNVETHVDLILSILEKLIVDWYWSSW